MIQRKRIPVHRFGSRGNRRGPVRFSAEDVNYAIRINRIPAEPVPVIEIGSKDLCFICRKRFKKLWKCTDCKRQVCRGDMGEDMVCLACIEKSVLGDE